MKNSLNLGIALNKAEQKSINGGDGSYVKCNNGSIITLRGGCDQADEACSGGRMESVRRRG